MLTVNQRVEKEGTILRKAVRKRLCLQTAPVMLVTASAINFGIQKHSFFKISQHTNMKIEPS